MSIMFRDKENVFRQVSNPRIVLGKIHEPTADCAEGCVIHNPSDNVQNRENWPYNWRGDRGIMERLCEHGIGHPDLDSAAFHRRNGRGYENVHGCDFCCYEPDEEKN